MFKNSSLKVVLIISGLIISLITIVMVTISSIQLKDIENKVAYKETVSLPHIFDYLDLQLDVIQVQQWFTDVSATRAHEGFDDGFEMAKEYFVKGNKVLDHLILEHEKHNFPKMVEELESFKSNFASFYDVGFKMANTYVKEGPTAGNKMMLQLDPFAEKLSGKLDEWIIENKKVNNKKAEEIDSIIITSEYLQIALGLILIISIFLIFFMISQRILSSINNFQNGLLGFFSYLNKEADDVKQLDDSKDDEFGKMSKVININIDHTKSLLEQDSLLIENVKEVVNKVNQGQLNQTVDVKTENKSLEELKELFNDMLKTMCNKICSDMTELEVVLKSYQNVDFSTRINNADGDIAKGINSLANIINEILVENKSNGLTLQNSSNTLMSNVDKLSTSSTEAAASLEETAAALEEITNTMTGNTNNIIKMSGYAHDLDGSSSQGQELANKTTLSMDQINEQVNSISDAITVIDQIAFQTNILSLNAAVEAATAGEAGKGFAVVAAEVRNLASRSAEAAKEIKHLVESATLKANDGKIIADKMISGYAELSKNVSNTLTLISDIEQSSREQQSGIEQINTSVSSLDTQTQKNAEVASQTRLIAESTLTIANAVVQSANEKEFIGKDTIKAKNIEVNIENKKEYSPVSPTKVERKVEVKAKKVENKVIQSTDSSDEWESF